MNRKPPQTDKSWVNDAIWNLLTDSSMRRHNPSIGSVLTYTIIWDGYQARGSLCDVTIK